VEPHNYRLPAVQEKLNQSSRPLYHAYVEDAGDSKTGQMGSDSQRSSNLNAWPQSDHNDDSHDQGGRQDGQPSGQAATSLTPHQPDTTQPRASKRKQY